MSLIRIDRNPTGRKLLVFGLAWLLAGGILGLRLWARGHSSAAEIVWALAAGAPLAGSIWPRLLRQIYVGLSCATYPVGLVVSCAILAVVYYLILTPLGLAMRIFRHDPLCRRFDRKAASYWSARESAKSVESYFRQG